MLNIEQSLDRIESWLDKKGFVLCKSKKKTIEDEVDFERKVVFLSLRSSPINQLYSLLHECGHVIIRGRKDYKIKYKNYYRVSEEVLPPTMQSSVEEVEEEINAWREGENLCIKLSIDINTDEYYKYASKWVMSYIVLAAIGNEHLLPLPKDNTEEDVKETNKSIDLRKVLDNAHDSCYCKVIAKPD
jgi:hypothetical protein